MIGNGNFIDLISILLDHLSGNLNIVQLIRIPKVLSSQITKIKKNLTTSRGNFGFLGVEFGKMFPHSLPSIKFLFQNKSPSFIISSDDLILKYLFISCYF